MATLPMVKLFEVHVRRGNPALGVQTYTLEAPTWYAAKRLARERARESGDVVERVIFVKALRPL